MVIFGDSLSDNGNLNHLLKSLRLDEDPAYLVFPLKQFVFNKMDDFAEAFYVPQSILFQGKAIVRHFLDDEVAPVLASVVGGIRVLPLIPEPPYWEHHFTNGKVWNEQLAEKLGINILDKAHFDNQAFGGSWAMTYDYELTTWNLIRSPLLSVTNLIQGKLIPPSLGLEVEAYLMAKRKFDKDATYFIFAGGNDYLNMLQFDENYNAENAASYVDHTIDGITSASEKLIRAGARKIVLFSTPDIAKTPFYNTTSDKAVLDETIKSHNGKLRAKVGILKALHPEVKFTYVDIAAHMNEVIDNPTQFSIKETQNACTDIELPTMAFSLTTPAGKAFGHNIVLQYMQHAKTRVGKQMVNNVSQCQSPDEYLFWDYVHPTAKVHKLLADKICSELQEDGYDISTC